MELLTLDPRTRDILARRFATTVPRRRGWLLHRALALADALGLFTAFLFVVVLLPEDGQGQVGVVGEILVFVALLPLWILLAKLTGLYGHDEERLDHSTVDDITGVFSVITIGTWLFFLVTEMSSMLSPSLERIVTFWLVAVALVPLARAIARSLCRRTLAYVQNTVVVGVGAVGRQIARKVVAHPELGLNLVGFVDVNYGVSAQAAVGGLPVLGTPGDLNALVPALDIERVIVSFTEDGHDRALALVRELRDLHVQIDIVPRLFEAVGTSSTVHMIEGMPLVGLPPITLSPSSRFLKRSFDVVGATLGLLLFSPFFLAVAVAIKVDSRGPVFFRQARRGEAGCTFRIFKFRTMTADAEQRKVEVEHLNMHIGGDSRMFKVPDDPRLTRVGRGLRRASIDELPQLINVLRGEMSLVGPRPLIPEEADLVLDWARKRLELRPGITGLWQVLGRSDIPFGEMTKLDYLYVTSWSLKEDIRLILLTLPSLMRQRRAF